MTRTERRANPATVDETTHGTTNTDTRPHPFLVEKRILIGLSEISGHASGLRHGFRTLGYACDLLELTTHPFSYSPVEDPTPLAPRIRDLQRRRDDAGGLRRKTLTVRILALRARLLFWAARRYDVFIMNGNAFFLGRWELRLLRVVRKRLVRVFHGSDTRPPYIDGTFVDRVDDERLDAAVRDAGRKKRLVRSIEKSGSTIVTAPAWGHFQERPFVPYLVLGFPVHRPVEPGPPLRVGDRPVRVLHSPSNPRAKGTEKIRSMVGSIREEGLDIEYQEIMDEPNQVVLERLRDTDIVLDQMYASTPMAGFATEASLFGRPAVIGSYYVDHLEQDIPQDCIPPTVFVHPDAVVDALRALIRDPDRRVRLGAEAQRFVTGRYAPAAVAARFVRLIVDDVPEEWWYDPRRIRYLHGGCLDETLTHEFLARYVDRFGKGALRLADKPGLEEAFLAFVSDPVSNRPK